MCVSILFNSPYILSLSVVLVGGCITLYGQHRQAKVQERTTIQKEWVEKVRGYTATCLFQAANVVSVKEIYGDRNDAPETWMRQYLEANHQFLSSQYSLSMYINHNSKIEKEFYVLITHLFEEADKGDSSNVYYLIPQISLKANEIFSERIK